MRDIRNIVILTGAGISAESGLATFRGPDGLWEGHRVENACPLSTAGSMGRCNTSF
jgi:NAD-dependent deacetylase